MNGYLNGFIERKTDGRYQGQFSVEGINLTPIEGHCFKRDNETYIWLRRKKILEYSDKTESYSEREAQPRWECYIKKQMDGNTIAYKGVFTFMHFKFSIIGVWDKILGSDKHGRLNLFVERLPMSEQTIINGINERKRYEQERRKNSK